MTHRAFRFRLYPTPDQEVAFTQYAGVCRLIYNLAFEQRRDFWRQFRRSEGRHISFESQSAELTKLRAEVDWIAAVSSEALTYALRDLDKAFKNYFAGRTKYPQPRKRDQGHGFRVKGRWAKVRVLSRRWAEVQIPKIGWVRFRSTRPILGTVRNVSISATAGAWHVSFAADYEREARTASSATVGLDLGVARTVCLSTGEHHSSPAPAFATLARAQKALARKRKGSRRRDAQKRHVAKIHARITRRRSDWAHKTSTGIANRFGLVIAEDLKIKAMMASAAGTLDEPGKGVAQKRGLNRAIASQGWGILTAQLAYKLEERGGRLIFVNPKHTSQTCSACGVVDRESRESQARFLCVHCGHEDNADVNAAKEILRRGTAWLDVEAGSSRPAKRQSKAARHA